MNTGYFEYGAIVNDRKRIMYNYFKSLFWADFLPLIGFLFSENESL